MITLDPTAEVREAVGKGGVVLVAARVSTESGKAAYRAVVDDLQAAIRWLADNGLDFSGVLPSDAEMIKVLRASPALRSVDSNGKPFEHRFATIDLRQHGLVIDLAIGSGKKVAEVTLIQPYTKHLTEEVHRVAPVLVFVKRLDRMTRAMLDLADPLRAMQAAGSLLGDTRRGIRRIDDSSAVLFAFFEAYAAEDEAAKMPSKTRNGMIAHTGDTMVGGQVRWGLSSVPPPGFAFVRLKDPAGRKGQAMVYLETEAARPKPGLVSASGSTVSNPDGTLVDQVENVRWALSVLGRPEWPDRRVTEELVRRRFSTESVRRINGVDAVIRATTTTGRFNGNPVKGLLANLEVYRTGTIEVPIGVDGFDPVTIGGCFPLDGRPWAPEEDFNRIDAMIARRTSYIRRRSLSLAGLPVTFNDQPCVLRSYWYQDVARFRFNLTGDESMNGEVSKVPEGSFPIPYAAVAESLIDTLRHLEGRPIPVFSLSNPHQEALVASQQQLADAEGIRAELAQTADRLYARVLEEDELGTPVVHGPLLAKVQYEYNRIVEDLLPDAELTVRRLADATRALESGHASSPVPATDLLRVAKALRDPADDSFAYLWPQLIEDLRFVAIRTGSRHRRTKQANWTGTLVLPQGDGELRLPIRGEWHWSAGQDHKHDRTQEALAGLLDGVPFASQSVTVRSEVRKSVAAVLGIDPKTTMLFCCEDPHILSTAAYLLTHPEMNPNDAAAELGLPVDFTHRVATLYRQPSPAPGWKLPQRANSLYAKAYQIATANGGVVTYDELVPNHFVSLDSVRSTLLIPGRREDWEPLAHGLRIKPCPNCGEIGRAPMDIPEPQGSVCLSCFADHAGILWPADPYAAYLCPPPTAPGPSRSPKGPPRSRKRRARDVPPAEVKEVIELYRNFKYPIKGPGGILEHFNITATTLYRILDAVSEPRRRRRTTYWTTTGPHVEAPLEDPLESP